MKFISQIRFQPTFACNLRCRYCYLGKKRKKPSEENFSEVAESAKLLALKILDGGYKVKRFLFHGAESTVLPPKLFGEICNIFWPIVCDDGHQQIQTNGTLLTSDYIDAFGACLNPSVRVYFSISVDGPRAITDKNRGRGTYDKAVNNALLLVERGYRVMFFSVLTPEMMSMLDKMEQWVQWLEDKNISWQFQLASSPNNLSNDQQVRLAHWLHERCWHFSPRQTDIRACMSKGNDCHVLRFNADGTMSPCDRDVSIKYPIRWKEMTFDEVLEVRKGWYADRPVSKKCSYCPIRPICNSGCPVFRIDDKSNECVLFRTICNLEAKRMGVTLREIVGLFRRKYV